MAKQKDGPGRRALRMAALGAGVTGSYLGYLAQSAFLDAEARENRVVPAAGPARQREEHLLLHADVLEDPRAERSE